jgi:hypothetical protein
VHHAGLFGTTSLRFTSTTTAGRQGWVGWQAGSASLPRAPQDLACLIFFDIIFTVYFGAFTTTTGSTSGILFGLLSLTIHTHTTTIIHSYTSHIHIHTYTFMLPYTPPTPLTSSRIYIPYTSKFAQRILARIWSSLWGSPCRGFSF